MPLIDFQVAAKAVTARFGGVWQVMVGLGSHALAGVGKRHFLG